MMVSITTQYSPKWKHHGHRQRSSSKTTKVIVEHRLHERALRQQNKLPECGYSFVRRRNLRAMLAWSGHQTVNGTERID